MFGYLVISVVIIIVCLGAYLLGLNYGERKGKIILKEAGTAFDKILDITPPDKYKELETIVDEFYNNIKHCDEEDNE